MSVPKTKPRVEYTEAERSLAVLTADAVLRHAERGDWPKVMTFSRSLLQTATGALRREQERDRRAAVSHG